MSAVGRIAVVLAGAFALASCARCAPPAPDAAARTQFARGVGLGLFATDPDYDYGGLLDEIAQTGATDVMLAVVWYQADLRAHDIRPVDGLSPRAATLVRTLRQAKQRGLRTALLPIVRLTNHTRDEWRGRIEPDAGVDAWWAAYEAFLGAMFAAARDGGADRVGLGSELLTMERHQERWRALAARARREVPRAILFYSANWDHYRPIQWWDAVDEIGVTAYFELTRDEVNAPTDDDVLRAWEAPRDDLARFAAEVGKPLIITEIGYPSKVGAARWPWDETREAPSDPALQARLYDRFCDAFAPTGVLRGVFFWNWFGFGGAGDDTYSPRGKPAAQAMARCFARPAWDARPNF